MGGPVSNTGWRRSPTKQANVPDAGMICIAVPTATAQTAGSSGSVTNHPSHTSALVSGTTSVGCLPATSRKSQTALAVAATRSSRTTSDHVIRAMSCSHRRPKLAAAVSATLTRRSSSRSGGVRAARSNGVTSGFRATAEPVGATSLRRRREMSTAPSASTR